MLKQSVEYEVWQLIMGAPSSDERGKIIDETRIAVGELENVKPGVGSNFLREAILKKEFANETSTLDVSDDWDLLEVRTRPFPQA